MKLCHVAVILYVLYGLPGFIRAEGDREVAEGGNITVGCPFKLDGHTKLFCKNNCDEEKNILVKTSENEQCKGRYCIKYEYKGLLNGYIMYVNITNVTSADSGQYQCVVNRNYMIDGKHEFTINVKNNAALNPTYTLKPEPNVTVKPTTDMDLTVQTGDQTSRMSVTTTQHSLSPKPQSNHSSASPDHEQQTKPSGVSPLYVSLSLVAILILLLAALLIFYCKKRSKASPVITTEYGSTPVTHRVYEEIPDNRASRPVEMSTVYASASFSGPPEDHTSDVYSLATTPGDQHQEEDSIDKVTYTEVDFPNSKNMSENDAPQRQAEAVLYSVVQVQNEDSLYSTVSRPEH
ncbi:uncharacterized protein LOC129412364 isoform X1 [Boleophthalmus pectinirostris]|uniref:uncharacterized protein LOC129412364 isoform X1 n=1 Tax=Boleophthalmus pectinirostris TaxID=150288 RepID=UPI00242B5EAF|nr:uncharacterized protein LOC129412364 isoform X1 [Boleophthalmus pectinirostris]